MVEEKEWNVKVPVLSHASDGSGNAGSKMNSLTQNSSQTLNSIMFMEVQIVFYLPRTINILI